MRVLVDTNVVLDVPLARTPFVKQAASVFALVEESRIEASLCATTLTTVDSLLAQSLPRAQARRAIRPSRYDRCRGSDALQLPEELRRALFVCLHQYDPSLAWPAKIESKSYHNAYYQKKRQGISLASDNDPNAKNHHAKRYDLLF